MNPTKEEMKEMREASGNKRCLNCLVYLNDNFLCFDVVFIDFCEDNDISVIPSYWSDEEIERVGV